MSLIDTSNAAALSALYLRVRNYTEELSEPLSPEDQTVQSMPDTSPTKWHRAHTTWFFETFILEPYESNFARYDEIYNFLFNSYYVQVGDRFSRPDRGLISRPGAAEIAQYRANVDGRIVALIESADDATRAEIATLLVLGCHHEQQHQELLLMDIKHVLSINPTEPAYSANSANSAYSDSAADGSAPTQPSAPPDLGWVEFEGGVFPIGKNHSDSGFTFDNEGPEHDALIGPFKLADRLITCGEWLNFMADDGYHRAELWLSEGWAYRNEHNWEAPLYWHGSDHGWVMHTLTGTRPVDPNEPVCHVSFYEADAFASWADARLPTEFEWERAAQLHIDAGATAELTPRLHPVVASDSELGLLGQMFGECWEWTGSQYRPYPGFKAPDGAIGEYNGKFMINQMVLRGGCAYTSEGHIRPTYRNFFPAHTRWHLSGVRLAKDS